MVDLKVPIEGHENDKIIIFAKRHIASMIGTILLIFLMMILPVIIIFLILKNNPELLTGYSLNFLVIFGSIYYLVTLTFSFVQWVSYYYNIFIVTDNEIIDISQEGIFDRRISTVTLLRIQDVSARIRGFLPTFFGYGDVVAESAGENTRTYIIDRIPRPVEVANKILSLHNEIIEREGRQGEVVTAEGDLRSATLNWPKRDETNSVNNTENNTQEKICPPCPSAPTDQSVQPSSSVAQLPEDQVSLDSDNSQGEVKKDDLNSGGEIKL